MVSRVDVMDSEAERASLMQVSRDWARAAADRDVDLIVSFWADDAVVLPPDQPTVAGKKAIREYIRQSLAMPGFSITWEPEQAFIAAGGRLGYMVERNRVTFLDESGKLRTQGGKAVTVWAKNFLDKWKRAVDIWNDNPSARESNPL